MVPPSKTRLRLTLSLVLLSFALGAVSIATGKAGLGEAYPFFHWKLYSQPLGWELTFTEYRIYYQPVEGGPLKRKAIAETETFNYDQYVYTFNDCVKDYLTQYTLDRNRARLHAFAKHIQPEAKRWHIVAETYNPLLIIYHPQAYDTATVVAFGE